MSTHSVSALKYTDQNGNVFNLIPDASDKAPLASPAFTGTPTAPTAADGTNNTQIATTAFVMNAFSANDAMLFKGTIGSSGATVTALPANHKKGWTYKVATAGTYAGVTCEIGDTIYCVTNGSTANDAHWAVVQANIDGAVTGPASSTANHVAAFNGTNGKVIKDSGFTIEKSVPSNAVFTDTDTKVTSAANHYSPSRDTSADKSASASGATAAWSIDVVKGITLQTDGKGHVTGVAVTSGKIPANPNTDTHRVIKVNGTQVLASNTTALNLIPGSNVSITDGGSGAITIAATDTTYTAATQSANGLMSSTDKTKLDGIATGATANTGTVTSVATGTGLTGGTITGSGTLKADLISETKLTNAAADGTETAGRVYPVRVDKNGKLAVNVPWTDNNTNTTYTLTQDSTDGHKITLTPSSGSATTITIPDNNTTYESKTAASGGTAVSLVTTGEKYNWNNKASTSTATQSNNGLMSSTDKTKLDGIATGATANTGTITGIKMNGASKGTSGVVDLGTVITSHQDISGKANLASPALTGTPTAPTAADGTNTTQIATTAFVMSAFKANDAMVFKGTIGSSGATVTALPNTHYQGWTYRVLTAGTYAGKACEIGDMIICVTDGTSANNNHWTVVQTNIDGAVTGPSSSTDAHVAVFNGASGKAIKDSGFTIGKSVPSNAVFTDTTYSAATQSANGLMSSTDKTKLDGIATGATANTGTVTKVSTGAGLTGGDVTSTGTIKANLTSETNLANAAADGTETSGRVYPVRLDKNGKLAVNVPWTDNNTTYTFDGTYNASTNKAATVSTVTNAINALDGNLNSTTPGVGKTLTAFSQTDGKVSATFGNISITKSQVSDFPTSMTPASHTHGNIQNGGTLQTNDITIANGDKLVVTDSSNSSKIARASISFDGSTTTQALTKKGTWETFAPSSTVSCTAANVKSALGTGSGTTKYLREDGTWQDPDPTFTYDSTKKKLTLAY